MLLILYLESAFEFSNLAFRAFCGFSFESSKRVVIEGEGITIGGRFSLHTFFMYVVGKVGSTFCVDFDFGSLESFDKEGSAVVAMVSWAMKHLAVSVKEARVAVAHASRQGSRSVES